MRGIATSTSSSSYRFLMMMMVATAVVVTRVSCGVTTLDVPNSKNEIQVGGVFFFFLFFFFLSGKLSEYMCVHACMCVCVCMRVFFFSRMRSRSVVFFSSFLSQQLHVCLCA
jgi:hypothetical protein